MAEKEIKVRLTNHQIMMVAAEISVRNMKTLAEEYLKLPTEMIETIAMENKDDDEAFKRSVIRRWVNMNSEHQVKVKIKIYLRRYRFL